MGKKEKYVPKAMRNPVPKDKRRPKIDKKKRKEEKKLKKKLRLDVNKNTVDIALICDSTDGMQNWI